MFISFKKSGNRDRLWQRFVAGDKSAFGELYTHYHTGITAYCIGKIGNVELAENVASDTLIKLLQFPNPAEIENFENWIFTVAKNECLTFLSKSERRRRLLNDNYEEVTKHAPEVESIYSVQDMDKIIRETLEDKDYKIWMLHQQGYDNSEIAEMTSINVKTIANRKSMIRVKLKAVLKEIMNG